MPQDYLERYAITAPATVDIARLVNLNDFSRIQRDLMRLGEPMPAPGDWKPVCQLTEAQLRFMGPEFRQYCTEEIVNEVKKKFGTKEPILESIDIVATPIMEQETLSTVGFRKPQPRLISRWAPR